MAKEKTSEGASLPAGARRGGFAANPSRASEAGKRGAATVKERLGSEHFKRMGKLGGTAVKQKYGPDYYREIGRRGGRSRWDAEKAKKEAETTPSGT
jgi:general stress protein YciG